MKQLLWLCVIAFACLTLSGCPEDNAPRKPDPTKGTLTGRVTCTDTGKAARFATVQLLPVYLKASGGGAGNDSVDLDENGTTDLDGKFKIEAVPPGDYYAFATLDGYLDPTLGVDTERLGPQASEREKLADEIEQWKDHLVKLTVAVQRTTDISITIDRGAEIAGTVSYDDSSPAIGIRFELLRETAQDRWMKIGGDNGAMDEKSDGRGRYSIPDLDEGEYKVCALLPVRVEDESPKFCFGGGFRQSKAETVKVSAGETYSGVEIVLPLDGLFTVSGSIAAGTDAHAPSQATVHLLYADDREEARKSAMLKDGSFSFAYVPAGDYILQVTNAQDVIAGAAVQSASGGDSGSSGTGATGSGAAPATPQVHKYLDKETPLSVQGDMDDVRVTLIEPPPPQQASQ